MVRPDKSAGGYTFREIDVARARLILEMRDEMEISEDALPVVLLLLDQLYDLRRQMRDLNNAFIAGRAQRRETRPGGASDDAFALSSNQNASWVLSRARRLRRGTRSKSLPAFA